LTEPYSVGKQVKINIIANKAFHTSIGLLITVITITIRKYKWQALHAQIP